jgi:glycosyltransferase involved in cell wall biosynthesis
MKKIVILVDQLNSHGGIEKLVSIKANYWAEVFHYDVTIIATEQDEKPIIYHLSEKVKFIDLAINYNRLKSYFSVQNFFRFLKNIYKIQQFLFKEKPDFILVASHIPITYFAPFLLSKAKTIKEFHFTKSSRSQGKVLHFIESKYDFLVVLSNEERHYYPSNNVVVIPNPIESKIEANTNSNKENTAVFVGRIAAVKQLDKMVAIWKLFVKERPNWKLNVFGAKEGDYFEKINQLVLDNSMQESFIFKGQSNAIDDELQKAKVLLMTSLQECFPMVILEANAKGVPVISFDSPTGPRNIIHNNSDGILVEYNNIDSFVKELIRFADNEHLQQTLSENAIINAKRYNIDAIMNIWNDKLFTL